MKRWSAFIFSLLVCASYLCGYASPQDRQYVDYFLHLQAADLFRTRAFLLNWSCAYINVNSLQGVDFSFSCYRTLSLKDARSLLISVAEELVDKINKDPSIKERCLLSEPFTLKQICLKIETENVFSAQVDPETIRVMILDRGNITYESYRASTLYYGRTVTSRETLEMALMLLGKATPFGKEPIPGQAAEEAAPRAPLPPEAAAAPRVEVAAPESALQGSRPVRYIKEISPPSDFPLPGPEVPLSESTSVYWEDAVPPESPQWIQQIRATGGLASFTGAAMPSPVSEGRAEEIPGPGGTARWAESDGLNAIVKPPEAAPQEPAGAKQPLPSLLEPVKVESQAGQPALSEEKPSGPTGASGALESTVRNVLPRFHDLWRQVFPQPAESSPKPVADKKKAQSPHPKIYGLWKEEFPQSVESSVEEPSQTPEESPVQEPLPSNEEPPISVEVMRTVQVMFIQEQLFPLPIWNGWQLETFAEPDRMAMVAEAGQKGTSPDDLSKIIAHPPHEVLVPTPIESSESDSWSIDRWFEEMGLIPKEEPPPAVEEDSPPSTESQPEPKFLPAEPLPIASVDDVQPVAEEPQAPIEDSSPAPAESPPADVLPPQPGAEEPAPASGGWFSWLTSSSSAKSAPDMAMPPAEDSHSEPSPADTLPPQPEAEEPAPASGGWFSWLTSSPSAKSAPDIAMLPEMDDHSEPSPADALPPAADDHSEFLPPEPSPADTLPPQPEAEEPSPASGGWFSWLTSSSSSAKSAPDMAMPPTADDHSEPSPAEALPPAADDHSEFLPESQPPEPSPADTLLPQPKAEELSPASGGWFSWLTPSSSAKSAPDMAMPPAADDHSEFLPEPSPAEALPPAADDHSEFLPEPSPAEALPPAADDHSEFLPESLPPEPLPVDVLPPQPEPVPPESVSPAPQATESVDLPQPKAEDPSVGEWFSWLVPSSSTEPVSEVREEAAPTVAVEENSSTAESDEEILAWVERFGSWAREKVPDEPVLGQLKIPEASQPTAAVEAMSPNQLDELARSEELLGSDRPASIAERLGEVTRPDEVWKDLDQDDYCPDDDNGEDHPTPPSPGTQEPIAERLGEVVRPDEVWKDLDQEDYCPGDVDDLDEDVSYFNRNSRM